MSRQDKSYKKRYEDEDDENESYKSMKKAFINKRRAKRFDRALKTKNIDELIEYENLEEGGGNDV